MKNNENVMVKVLIFLSLQIVSMVAYKHEQPVAENIWRERCNKNSFVLNDCNWCSCNQNHQFTCKARVCSEIDMFGHFNDAIREISVGMRGHGVWRSKETACEPGVHYRRNGLLCVCGEDGTWPSPVCRDIFRILHSVEITTENEPSNAQKCTPTKLHLIGCKVCFCPESGRIDPKLCTQSICTKEDPIVAGVSVTKEIDETIDEVYADCLLDRKYKLGCKTCVCLRNNRLLCSNCTNDNKAIGISKSVCNVVTLGKIFSVDCNLCYCDDNDLIYCTVKRCVHSLHKNSLKKQLSYDGTKLKTARKPIEDENCYPGTKYKKNCNTCYCIERGGAKIFGCTLKQCLRQIDIHTDCVVGTMYEMNCLICHCEEVNGVKRQSCKVDRQCARNVTNIHSNNFNSLHGYCEPLHVYKKDCNTCRCLSDGKTITCTTKACEKKSEPVTVEILPVMQYNGICPEGHSYKINCNICVCLSNGNIICTTAKC